MTWVIIFGSALSSWALVGLVRMLAIRFKVIDVPNDRSSHTLPTPRGGGIAIVMVTLSTAIAAFYLNVLSFESMIAWTLGGIVIAAVGLLDDLHGLSPIIRLEAHCVAAGLLLAALAWMPDRWRTTSAIVLQTTRWTIGGIAIVWSINLFNFMDGIDGLAASQCAFVAGAVVLLQSLGKAGTTAQWPLLALFGAALGFLVWNFPSAKIFMGDVGSGFIGFAISAAAIFSIGQGRITLWTWITLDGLFLADATTTLLVRLLRGECIYQAHRSHGYQHLAKRYTSHRNVTILYSVINLIWCLPFAAATAHFHRLAPILSLASLAPLFGFALIVGAGKPHPHERHVR